MRVVFVTGTDTGVGKTVVTAALAAATLATGASVHVVKPAQTGVAADEPGDADVVRRLSGADVSEGVRLRAPLAPDAAARLQGLPLPDIREQRDLVLDAAVDVVLVEGSGGVLVRLGNGWDLRDLAAAVAHRGVEASFVVVARAGLGTLNHTALTVAAIEQRSLAVEGVVIGAAPAVPDLAAEQNLLDLPRMSGAPIIGSVPEEAGSLDPEAFAAAAPSWVPALTR